ncbi:hypothetical protein Poly21_50890 [Allorhodopirellula heiligendammensis]|uniref:HEPN domain-containing protein n=1 Tax=Allorhodopirellula heiligendammensis TaxID=2714739 RepID=A0A5C6BDS2_9BACT|nr:hypothetical protein Poly21_50890 [Allorhodopirellula heiligendammensis]
MLDAAERGILDRYLDASDSLNRMSERWQFCDFERAEMALETIGHAVRCLT